MGVIIRLVLACAALLAGPVFAQDAPSFGHYQPAPRYDGMVSNSIYVTLRDGVRIAVRIDRPTQGGRVIETPLPVIWHHSLSIAQQTADGAGERLSGYRRMQELTRHGYVVVQAARRGNGQSTGAMRGYHDRNEAQDAFELIDWLANQPWSDGKVGMYGCSNTGDAVMHALSMRPPALKAAFAGCFSWHKFDAFRRGGIFAQWGTGPSRSIEQDMAVPPIDGDADKVVLGQAAREHQLSTPLLEMWRQLPFRDSHSVLTGSRFWAEGSAANYRQQIVLSGVPLYIQGGWRDELRDQGMIAHLNLPGSRIVIGPWKHCDNDDFHLLQEMHRFFDRYLKGIDTGIDGQPPINYFTINAPAGNEWRSASVWPLPQQQDQTWFLGGGTILARAGRDVTQEFVVRTDIACPASGSGARIQPCHVAGSGASFTGRELRRPLEVTGNPLVRVWVASNRADANVFAYLEDVSPDGTVEVVTEGRLKASLRAVAQAPWQLPAGVPWHRGHAEDAARLVPGAPVELNFDMMPTSWIFRSGHRVQLTVTGSDHRERLRDPAETRMTVLMGRGHPSQVTLPVIPAR